MSWENIIKAKKIKPGTDVSDDKITPNPSRFSTSPSPSTQGLHVTKFYMFMKRWLADTHTEKFLEYYIPYPELEGNERREVHYALQYLLGPSRAKDSFPGIEIKQLETDSLELVFDDQKHLDERDQWIDQSEEVNQTSTWRRWWLKPPPYDNRIQSAWNALTRTVKKSKNWRMQYPDWN